MNMKYRKRITATIAVVLLFIAVVIAVYMGVQKENGTSEQPVCSLQEGISIVSVEAYTGPFLEDGSDRNVENIWKLEVENTSNKDIEYLNIHAEGPGYEGEFRITTLIAGSSVNVLEYSAMELPADVLENCVYTIENIAYLQQERSLYSDIFTLSVADNWIRLENHSEQDITNDVYVYYKTVQDGVLMGGITYRVKFEGGIPANEVREQQTAHFDPETSEILYLTYE